MRPFLQSLVVRLVVKLFRKNFTTPGIASSRALGVTLPPSGFANLAPPRRPRPVAAELAAWRLRNSSFPASSNSTRIRRPHADIRIAPNASRPLDLQNSGDRDPSFKKKTLQKQERPADSGFAFCKREPTFLHAKGNADQTKWSNFAELNSKTGEQKSIRPSELGQIGQSGSMLTFHL